MYTQADIDRFAEKMIKASADHVFHLAMDSGEMDGGDGSVNLTDAVRDYALTYVEDALDDFKSEVIERIKMIHFKSELSMKTEF